MTAPQAFASIPLDSHVFASPRKCIHSHADLPFFLNSRAHKLVVTFISHLSAACTPPSSKTADTETFFIDSPTIQISSPVRNIITLLEKLEGLTAEAPPDEGPRRFGNVAFRTWYRLVEERLPGLLKEHLPSKVTELPAKNIAPATTTPTATTAQGDGGNAMAAASETATSTTATEELSSYLLGSFGSAQRLDYGTGHELSFLAFLCGLWVLGAFETGKDELGITLHAFDRYLTLVRKLILLYNLEPAGSHGVWGLDDHSFLPYVFGSAQLSATPEAMGPPAPGSIIEENTVQRERKRNMYFGAIGFIRDVKKGPFWEHSPYLFDISGVIGGWKKINTGMMKMYSGEVLGKFPVVQHFPFGSIFQWELADGVDPGSLRATNDPHHTSMTANLPSTSIPDAEAKVPWSAAGASTADLEPSTTAPHTRRMRTSTPVGRGNTGGENSTSYMKVPGGLAPTIAGMPVTTAPWAKAPTGPSGVGTGSGAGAPPLSSITAAPWAKPGGGAQDGRPGVLGRDDNLSAMGPPRRPVGGVTATRGALPDRRPSPNPGSTKPPGPAPPPNDTSGNGN